MLDVRIDTVDAVLWLLALAFGFGCVSLLSSSSSSFNFSIHFGGYFPVLLFFVCRCFYLGTPPSFHHWSAVAAVPK